jgi:hypothetical protein
MSEPAAEIAHQFVDAGQQRDAATFGMWIFLCTEVLLSWGEGPLLESVEGVG